MTRPLKYTTRRFVSFIFILCGFLFLTGCNAYYNLFYTNPEKCFENCYSKKPYDVIIVPGFPHDSGKVNGILDQRVRWAYYLYKNNYTKNIIFSGGAVHSPYIEAEVMRLFALQLGIKKENIYTETRAEHTTENMYYSYIIAKDLGFKTIAFASQPAHTSFMKPFRRKFNLDIDFLPIIDDSLATIKTELKPIDESSAFVRNFIPLEKREGFIKNIRGTRGHKVRVAIRKARRAERKQNKSKK